MWLFPWLSYAVVLVILGVLVLLAFIPGEQLTLLLSALTLVSVLAALKLRKARPAAAAATVRPV